MLPTGDSTTPSITLPTHSTDVMNRLSSPAGIGPHSDTAQVQELLTSAIAETKRVGRSDLAKRLAAEHHQLTSGACHVLVAGEFKKGKSAFLNALVGLPLCAVDAVASTAVPTIIRHGQAPTADLVFDGDEPPPKRTIDVRAAASYARAGVDDGGRRLRAIEVAVPRVLLATGVVLVDTPGVGGGFAAAQAAATMRALSLADAVLAVSDASQEYTAAEVEFLRHAAEVCPWLLCLLTKTDCYPQWRRIRDINQQHLRRAGLDTEIIPVSSTLRELAIDTGDRALNSESGFPIVVHRLRTQLLAARAQRTRARALSAVRDCLGQVAGTLAAEHAALTRPDQRPTTLRHLNEAHARAERLTNPSSRWQNTLNDGFADIRSRLKRDVLACTERLEKDATQRIKAGDPTQEWKDIEPWLYQRANEELTDCHKRMLTLVEQLTHEIATLFASDTVDIGAITGGAALPATGDAYTLEQLSTHRPGRLDVGMQALRGVTLSSSVLTTTLLIGVLHTAALVILPMTAALGAVLAVKTVRDFTRSRVEAARNEAIRAVAKYLSQTRNAAIDASMDILRHSHERVRDYYFDRATELLSTTRQERAVTLRAADADDRRTRQRTTETATDLTRVRRLLDTADRVGRAHAG